jgi:hypothetical protein
MDPGLVRLREEGSSFFDCVTSLTYVNWQGQKVKLHCLTFLICLKVFFTENERFSMFFPRASERRVLPIVGFCLSSSHFHIFSSSHLLIFTSSHLRIFTSSHLLIFTSSAHLHIFTSAHLHIFSSSHLHILTSSHLLLLPSCPLAFLPSCPLALSFFSISLLKAGQGQCQRDGTKRNPFARNEVPSPKTEVKLRFEGVRHNPFARIEVRSPKI